MTIEAFVEAAREHGLFTESGDVILANAAYERLKKARKGLANNIDEEEPLLKTQLNSVFPSVRLWAAYYLLPIDSESASSTLRVLSQGNNLISFSAQTTLEEWLNGSLKII